MFTKSINACCPDYSKLRKISCYLSLGILLKAKEIISKERVSQIIGNYKIGVICFNVSTIDKKQEKKKEIPRQRGNGLSKRKRRQDDKHGGKSQNEKIIIKIKRKQALILNSSIPTWRYWKKKKKKGWLRHPSLTPFLGYSSHLTADSEWAAPTSCPHSSLPFHSFLLSGPIHNFRLLY